LADLSDERRLRHGDVIKARGQKPSGMVRLVRRGSCSNGDGDEIGRRKLCIQMRAAAVFLAEAVVTGNRRHWLPKSGHACKNLHGKVAALFF